MDFERRHRLAAGLIFLMALTLYTLTMAPTTSFWDCGEFIASSKTLSVPHPPGAPFYLLLGRAFTMVPFFADIGARVNFISVLSSALCVMLAYLIVIHLLAYRMKRSEMGVAEIGGAAIGALCCMAMDSFWFNAVEAEVYAISMLFTALVVWLAFVWHKRVEEGQGDGTRILLLIFYLIGLAIGVHLLNVLALPMVFMVIYFHLRPDDPLPRRLLFLGLCMLSVLPVYPGVVLYFPRLVNAMGGWVVPALFLGLAGAYVYGLRSGLRWLSLGSAATFLVLLGYLSYLLILIRSGLNPPLDENDPETLGALIRYLSREQYGLSAGFVEQYFNRKAPFWEYQVQHMYNRYLGWNLLGRAADTGVAFTKSLGLPFLLAALGAWSQFREDWRRGLCIFALFFLTGYAIVLYLNQPDPQPRERDYSYVGSFFAAALWVGYGATWLLRRVRDSLGRPAGLGLLAALLLLVPGWMTLSGYHEHDRSGNYVAWDYAHNALEMLEENAILFTNGDNDTFPLWYLQEVEGIRRDVRVVNLSLLNTGWYIRQLRDREPKVPLPPAFTDDFIARKIDGTEREAVLWRYWGPQTWKAPDGRPLPPEQWFRVPIPLEDGRPLPLLVEPTMRVNVDDGMAGNNFLRVQDRMILEILKANRWEKPVYMAITVPFSNHAGTSMLYRMDGLAFRMLGTPGPHLSDPEILDENLRLFEEHLRGFNDPKVHFSENILRIAQNYRSTYLELLRALEEQGRAEDIPEVVARHDRFLPDEVLPITIAEHRRSFDRYRAMGN